MTTYLHLFDDAGNDVTIPRDAISRIDKAPGNDDRRFADRYELRDGTVAWSSRGNRGWHDEHKMQGGLRTIKFVNSMPAVTLQTTEIVYRWPDGREEVRYRRPYKGVDAAKLIAQVDALRSRLGDACPYFYRHV